MNRLIKQAFTLIELLVVIAIIGVLSGLIIVAMNGTTEKATIAKNQVFSNSLRNSLMLNLISEWKLDEGAGTNITDSWSGGNTGTLSGPTHLPTWKMGSDCVSGSCVQFDGTDDYISVPDANNLDITNTITISIWIKMNDKTSFQNVLSKGSAFGAQTNYNIGIYSNLIYWDFFAGGLRKSTTRAISGLNIGTWYNIVTVYDGTYSKIYFNGLVNTPINMGSLTLDTNVSLLSIGKVSSTYFFNGLIDEVRIYNAAMPTSRIKEQYYVGLNKLLANEGITKEEYLSRINSIATNE